MAGSTVCDFCREKNAKDLKEVHLPAIAAVTTITTTATTATAPPTAASVAAPAAAITAAAPAWPPTPTAASTFSLGPCFVHYQVAPAKVLAVKGVHGAVSIFVIIHFHEREPARLPGEPVPNQIDARRSYTDLREPLVELIFCSRKRKVTDIELLHLRTPSFRNPTRVAERTEEHL
jgi:hypothetical protein